MKVDSIEIADVKLLTPRRFDDERGFFSETYNQKMFDDAGVNSRFIQDNHSYSARKGTLRGLHFQAPPFAQAKLIRVLRGAIFDVVVDARKKSPTFGQWAATELTAQGGVQLFVPAGFLHGFLTLEADTEIVYKVDAFYDGPSDGAVRWNDPDLAIEWGVGGGDIIISDKDARAQSWADFASPF